MVQMAPSLTPFPISKILKPLRHHARETHIPQFHLFFLCPFQAEANRHVACDRQEFELNEEARRGPRPYANCATQHPAL
jgi:hypothetical protein